MQGMLQSTLQQNQRSQGLNFNASQTPNPQKQAQPLSQRNNALTTSQPALTKNFNFKQFAPGMVQSITTISKFGEPEIKEIIREVPIFFEKIVDRPVIIEKKVEVPVDRPVFIDKTVQMIREVPITIEKVIERPVEKTVVINQIDPEGQRKLNDCSARISYLEYQNNMLRNNLNIANQRTAINTTHERVIQEKKEVVYEQPSKDTRQNEQMFLKRISDLETSNKMTTQNLNQKTQELDQTVKELQNLKASNQKFATQINNQQLQLELQTACKQKIEAEARERHTIGELNKQLLMNTTLTKSVEKLKNEQLLLLNELENRRQQVQNMQHTLSQQQQTQSEGLKIENSTLKKQLQDLQTLLNKKENQFSEAISKASADSQSQIIQIKELQERLGAARYLEQANARSDQHNKFLEAELSRINEQLRIIKETRTFNSAEEQAEYKKLINELLEAREEVQKLQRKQFENESVFKSVLHQTETENLREKQALESELVKIAEQLEKAKTKIRELKETANSLTIEKQHLSQQSKEKQINFVKNVELERLSQSIHAEPLIEQEIEETIPNDDKRNSVETSDNLRNSSILPNYTQKSEIEILMRNNLLTVERQLNEAFMSVKQSKSKNAKLKKDLMFMTFRFVATSSELERVLACQQSN